MRLREQLLFEKHAELCGIMASPTRLAIFSMIQETECNVGEIARNLDSSVAKASQHLRLLRDKDLVTTRRDGQEVYYRLKDPRIMEAYRIIREVLVEKLREQGALADCVSSI